MTGALNGALGLTVQRVICTDMKSRILVMTIVALSLTGTWLSGDLLP